MITAGAGQEKNENELQNPDHRPKNRPKSTNSYNS